jgi:diguanylate cyclase
MSPFEIAREALKRLALQRTPPTPDNYRSLYHEIAGTSLTEAFPEKSFKSLVGSFPRNTPEQMRFARQFDAALTERNWESMKSVFVEILNKNSGDPPNWSGVIRDLMQRLEVRQADLTPARKREALDHVLASSNSPELLYTRLQSLLKSWAQGGAIQDSSTPELSAMSMGNPDGSDAVTPAPTITSGLTSAQANGGATTELLDLLAQLLETSVGIVLADNKEMVADATRLATAARSLRSPAEIATFIADMKRFGYRLHFVAEDQVELRSSLLHLLHLVIDNINELVIDDQWLQGQIATVLELFNEPINLRRLDEVERRMKDVIFKQSSLKKSLTDAQDQLKAMLATFVDRLANLSSTTGSYHDKIEHCAEKIGKAKDISELTAVLDEVMRETRTVQLDAQRAHDELQIMRKKVEETEEEVARLQQELAHASEMVNHDPLTGALNRKGMNEALTTEVSRTKRQGGQMCLALLDIDNFKKLNDSLGHAAGDAALVHLAKVVEETIRPEDTLARYGGEEFVVILPNTGLEDAITAMTRVQRELTKRFFLHNNDKVLITFSCGVAELGQDETAQAALQRADGAMYLAKRAGKNRVLAA